MPITLGVDLGTTSITALALDTASGEVLARRTRPTPRATISPEDRERSRHESDPTQIVAAAVECLRELAAAVGWRKDLAGVGITGQQHGVTVVDDRLSPQTPFIGWQDRRGQDPFPGANQSYVQRAAELIGDGAARRTGCRLATGYLAVTLFWLKQRRLLPPSGRACFLMDYFAALLTHSAPVTDATCAASSGVFDVRAGAWADDLIGALGLPRSLFPEVRPAASVLGGLAAEQAEATGLPAGLPVCVGIGDNQASFFGSVADARETVLVNVGTGAQVAARVEDFLDDPELETRPLPFGGYLLVCAGLVGGRSYAALEGLFRQVGEDLFGMTAYGPLFERMNALAGETPRGAGGLRCEPFFTGTRFDPELRASWSGVAPENFTPGHLARALLEGMARTFRGGYDAILRHLDAPRRRLVGAGNGLRENAVLARAVADAFYLPLSVPAHREEAAFGAALAAAVGTGVISSPATAGQLIRYCGEVAPSTANVL